MVFVETDETKAINGNLLDPHYTNRSFGHGGETVFLRPGYHLVRQYGTSVVEGCSYDYDDRIRSWYPHEEQEAAFEKAKARFKETKSAIFIQEYLRLLYKKPNLLLVHIVSGVNSSNGYPYRVYGYIAEPS